MSEQQVLPELIATLKAAAEKATRGPRAITYTPSHIRLVRPEINRDGWQRPPRTICTHSVSIGNSAARAEKLLDFEFIAAASPENILKLISHVEDLKARVTELEGK